LNALRGRPLAALGAGVLLAHLWVVGEVMPARLGDGAADTPVRRIEVAFVRELAPTAPPVVPPRAAPPVPKRTRVPVPARPASAPEPDVPPEPAKPELQASPPDPMAAAVPASAPEEPAPPPLAAASAPAEAASAPPAFVWPPSTRLSYRLTGHVRGPVEGYAKVEWLRAGNRYQVFMEASVGPPFAPLYVRRDSSEGEITPEGLSPRRYELQTKVVFREPHQITILLDGERIRLPNGRELPRPTGVQDAASQFVHMTWLFTTQPDLLTPGRSLDLTIALPRRVEPWTYDVLAAEPLDTRFGRIDTVHVKPRREARGGDYVAELWVAPTLQYLPVRILVRQDAETFIDLQIERLPEQAEPGR
jgi:hypothetical protein